MVNDEDVREVRKSQVLTQVSMDMQLNKRDVPLDQTEIKNLALRKMENEKNSEKVRSTMEEKFSQLRKETRKLEVIRNELAKLDSALSKNSKIVCACGFFFGGGVNATPRPFFAAATCFSTNVIIVSPLFSCFVEE